MTAKKAIKYLTRNFHISEFACKDGTKVPEHLIPNVQKLAEQLQILRNEINRRIAVGLIVIKNKAGKLIKEVGISVNSGFRTVKYNKKINGAKYSKHLKAMAGDIVCGFISAEDIQEIIEDLIAEGKMEQGGLGKYNLFTHYDVRGRKARW